MIHPTFFIIGAGKSGTTSLWSYLNAHPEISMSRVKEPSFFSMDAQWARGWDWYTSLFPADRPYRHFGEASNSYSALEAYPQTLERMLGHRPETAPLPKAIYSVRHPRDRTASDWMERQKTAPVSFETFLATDTLYRDKNKYLRTYDRYAEAIGPENIHVIFYDDLKSDPGAVVNGCLAFLGLEPLETQDGQVHRASSEFQRLPRGLERIKSLPWLEPVLMRLPPALKQKLRRSIGTTQTIARPEFSEADWQTFEARTRPQTEAFLTTMGKPVDYWSWDRT
ncbi:sulfotransferase family protein [Shimia ponticola]|uniref:sulfotransferase family protein n=1 Tax=Shimia ponticola TaxID=2582893 RepID=UPI0011BF43B4|nr:sulfotransferase [Shimia ponticola]